MENNNLLQYWGSQKHLSAHEAAALVCGAIPYSYTEDSGQRRAIRVIEEELELAMEVGDLESVDVFEIEGRRPGGGVLWATTHDAVAGWCRDKGFDSHLSVEAAAKAPATREKLYPKQMHTVISMLVALCDLAGIEIESPHSNKGDSCTEKIMRKMEELEIENPPLPRSVADLLMEARRSRE